MRRGGTSGNATFRVAKVPLSSAAWLLESSGRSMTHSIHFRSAALALGAAVVSAVQAHEVAPSGAPSGSKPVPIRFEVEMRGPVAAPSKVEAAYNIPVSGQGFWKFTPVVGAMSLPVEALPKLKGAHGTVLVDYERDVIYWGLENVGWVGFSNHFKSSWVVKGDPAFSRGNLHGADIFPRPGKPALIAAADNNEGEVYVTDTTFQKAHVLKHPPGKEYADGKGFAPTDVAFTDKNTVFVTDGYGRAFFMPADVEPFKYRGEIFGGKSVSQTPHGITFDPIHKDLIVSARPEAQVRHWSLNKKAWLDVQGLPPGSTVCDTDVWGDYVMAACLDGPKGSPGPIYVINQKRRAVVSTIKPKEDLGYATAQHMHDACWYVPGKGKNGEVYIIFTAWNPGGIGVLRLANVPN